MVGNKPFTDYLQIVNIEMNRTAQSIIEQMASPATPKKMVAALGSTLQEIEIDIKTISKALEIALKNKIVHLFSTNMLESRNRKDLLTPITFEAISSLKSDKIRQIQDIFKTQNSIEKFLENLNTAGLINYKCVDV
jgi:hypothetical protein